MTRASLRRTLAVLVCLPAALGPAQTQPLTVKSIFHDEALTADAPAGMEWSPDSSRMSYLDGDGNLMAVGRDGHAATLVSAAQRASMHPQKAGEEAEDHRSRYKQAAYLWDPDGRHLLFDENGALFLYSLDSGRGVPVAETTTTSGDDPKFAPDGGAITYIRDHNLYLKRLAGAGEPVALTKSEKPEVRNGEVDWLYLEELDVRSNAFWAPDSASVAFLQMDESRVPEYPIPDWLPVHPTVEMQRYPQPGDPNPAVRVGVVNVHSLRTQWVDLPLAAGDDYVPRFGWVDAQTLWVETLSRDHRHRRLYFAGAQTGRARLVLEEDEAKFFDESYDVTIEDGKLLWTSWRDGHTQIYLYGFDPAHPMSGEARLIRAVTHGTGEVISVEGLDRATGTVYYVSNEGDPREQQLWSARIDGGGERQMTHAHGMHKAAMSPDLHLFADNYSNLVTRPVLSLCHSDGGTCQVFWQPGTLRYRLEAPRELTLRAGDGTVLYASLMLPPGSHARGSIPVINNPYGGPHAQTVQNAWLGRTTLFDQVLADHGFAVLHVDNRGMGGRGRDFAEAAYRNFGPVQLADQLTAIDQVLARFPELDGHRLGWWGWSWGGAFTLYAMTHSDRIAAGVSVAPVTNWLLYDSTYTERYLGAPAREEAGYRDFSVINSADRLRGRLLMVHGTGDDNVHMGNTVQFVQKLIDADLPYDLQIYPRKTHSIAGPEARTHLYERILWQFDTYLGRSAGPQSGPPAAGRPEGGRP